MQDKIKALARFQFETGVYLVSLIHEDFGQSINDPWVDSTGRWLLTDEQAKEHYGTEFFAKWCRLAEEWLKKHIE